MANPDYVPMHSKGLCALLARTPHITNMHSYIFEKRGCSRAATTRNTS